MNVSALVSIKQLELITLNQRSNFPNPPPPQLMSLKMCFKSLQKMTQFKDCLNEKKLIYESLEKLFIIIIDFKEKESDEKLTTSNRLLGIFNDLIFFWLII